MCYMNMDQTNYELRWWADTIAQRNHVVHAAIRAGWSKNAIHTITGIARTTIDRILETPMEPVVWAVVIGQTDPSAAVDPHDAGISVPPYVAAWAAGHGVRDYQVREEDPHDPMAPHLVIAPWDGEGSGEIPSQIATLEHVATSEQVSLLRDMLAYDDDAGNDEGLARERAQLDWAESEEIAAETRLMWE